MRRRRSSKQEKAWLNSLKIAKKNRQVLIKFGNIKYIVDGYDPATNTVYEFYGDFWHGNPMVHQREDMNKATNSTFGYLYQKTIDKEIDIKILGYKLVTIWEFDWKKIKDNYE